MAVRKRQENINARAAQMGKNAALYAEMAVKLPFNN
jgi:hypothetical protein